MEIKNKRRKIHTSTKWLIQQNALPEKYLRQLDKSQICRYRKIDYQYYFGSEINQFSDEILGISKQIALNTSDQKMVTAYLRLAICIRNIFSSAPHFHKTLDKNKETLTDVIQLIKTKIPVRIVAKLIGIHESTIRNWITEIRSRCADSLLNLCRNAHPNQLLHTETNLMKKLLAEHSFRFWPLRSIYFYALNQNLMSMSLSTWYKYSRILNISRLKPRSVKQYKDGIRATRPNEYWHADVTYTKTEDGMLNYIYTVIDNYSRFPLVIHADTKLSGQIRMDTFRQALKLALTIHPTIENINLIVDGGSENFNGTVTDFLNQTHTIEIKRIRALKDISYSNSMAEALNRILKTYYLNNMSIENPVKLNAAIAFARQDIGYIRPHGLQKGLTPFQVYTGKNPYTISFSKQIKEARKRRTEINSKYNCRSCPF